MAEIHPSPPIAAPDTARAADDAPDHGAPDHEAFVERMNTAFGATYSMGGLAIAVGLMLFVGLSVAFFGFAALVSPLLWVLTLLVFLVSFFVLRIFVVRRAFALMDEVQAYCTKNALDLHALRAEFTRAGAYSFFESIFQVLERRDALAGAAAPTQPLPDADETQP